MEILLPAGEREKFWITSDLCYGVLYFIVLTKGWKTFVSWTSSLQAEVKLIGFDTGWAATYSAVYIFNLHFDTSSGY